MNKYYEEKTSAEICFGWNEYKELTVEIFGTNKITDEKQFGRYVNYHIADYLNKVIDYKPYIVIFKAFNRELCSVDHYKKIWRSDYCINYNSKLENKREMYSEHHNYKLYLGIAEIKDKKDFDYYNLIHKYSNQIVVLFSRNEYHLEKINSIMFADSQKTPVINYQKLCQHLCKNGDIVVRLGTDEVGGEIEFFYDNTMLF